MKNLFLRLLCVLASLGLMLVISCRKTSIDIQAEKAEIEKVIKYSIDWALTKDIDGLYDCFVQDSTFFIYHPDSQSNIVGFKAFKKMAEGLFLNDKFQAVDSEFKEMRINLSQDGSVAWYSCLLDDHGLWDGHPIGWDNCRWTGVLEKQKGKWVITQMHFSLAEDIVKAEASKDS